MDNGKLKILAIDSQEDNLTALKVILTVAFPGAQVSIASNGNQGMELALAQDPDVILLGPVLPGTDGCEVCRTLKSDNRLGATPVLILAASKLDRESRIRALEQGADGFVAEPFDEVELRAQIRAMAKIKVAQELPRPETRRGGGAVAVGTWGLPSNEERYRTIFENAALGIYRTTPDGHILEANPALVRMLGYARFEELAQRNLEGKGFEPGYDRSAFKERIESRGQVVGLESAWTKRDGTTLYVRENAKAVRNERGTVQYYEGTVEDITERKRADGCLRTLATATLELVELPAEADLFEFVGERVLTLIEKGIVAVDSMEGDILTIRKIVGARPAALKLARRLLGRSVINMPLQGVYAEARTGLLTGKLTKVEGGLHALFFGTVPRPICWTLTKSLGIRACHSIGMRHSGTIFGNVTILSQQGTRLNAEMIEAFVNQASIALERRRAEGALRTSEDRFRRMFEESPVGMVLTGRNFEFLQANPAFCRMLDYTPQEMNGKTFLDVTHPEHRVADRENVERLWRGQIPCHRTEKRYLAKNGDIRWGSLAASLIRTPEGEPHYVLATVEDITERKRSQTLMEMQRDLAVDLNAIDDLHVGLRVSLQRAILASGLDCGGAYLYDETSGGMDLRCHMGLSDAFVRQVSHYDRATVHVQLIMQGAPIYGDYARLGIPLADAEGREGLRAIAILPILHGRQVIGCLHVASRTLPEVPAYARLALETIAGQSSGAIVRLRAEQALRQSEEKFRSLFNNALVGMFRTRLDGSEILDANEKFLEIFGRTREEMLGLPSVVHWADLQERQEVLGRLETQGRVTDFECRMLNKRGEVLTCLISLTLYREQGILEGSIRDITDRKRAEEALKQSERRNSETLEFNKRILGTSSIGILTFRESGPCTFANEAAAKTGGTDVASLLAQNFHEVPSWKKSGMYQAAIRALDTGIEQVLETPSVTTFGKKVWVSFSFSSFDSGGERQLLVFARDVTDQRRAIEALQQSEQQFRAVAEYTCDLECWVGTDGRLIWVNPAVEGLTGYTVEECLAMPDFPAPFLHEEDKARMLDLHRQAVAGSSGRDVEYRILHKNGPVTWLSVSWQPIYALDGTCLGHRSSHRDITERKRAEEGLRESEEKFRSLFRAAPVAVFRARLDGTELLDVNDKLLQIFGRTREEMVGRPTTLFWADPRERQEMVRRLQAEGRVTDFECRLRSKWGEARTCLMSVTPYVHPGTIVGSLEDVTELRRMEQEVEERRTELLHVSRLSTLGEMAAGIAHELNQPLAAIVGYGDWCLHLLESSALDVPTIRKNMEEIAAQAMRASEIIRGMKVLAGRRAPCLTSVDVNQAVRDVIPLIRSDLVDQAVQWELDLQEPLPSVCADKIQIEQVLLNLMRNAVEAMESAPDRPGLLTVRTRVGAGNVLQVEVRDTGVGLSANEIERVFEPFFTTKPEGLGMGLAICRSIIQMYKGRIWAEPGPGRGCAFRFTLPTDPERPRTPRETAEETL